MSKNYKYIKNKIRDIEVTMLRENQDCWIKILPTKNNSQISTIHIMINNEEYHWELYDKDGKDAHKIYLKGNQIEPCFYLEIGDDKYSINFFYDKIVIKKIIKNYDHISYLRENYNFQSNNVSCWAVAIYMTSRKEEKPFCDM